MTKYFRRKKRLHNIHTMEICNTVTCKIMKRNNFANLILTSLHQNIYTVSYVFFFRDQFNLLGNKYTNTNLFRELV